MPIPHPDPSPPASARRPALFGLLVQLVALGAALALHRGLRLCGVALPLPWLAVVQGLLAAALSAGFRQSRWWWLIQALFLPLLLAVNSLDLWAGWWLIALLLVALLHWNSFGERVPLYLTGRRTERALFGVLDALPNTLRFVDLGCGLAGTLRRLARRYPDGQFVGVETAPLVFLLAWLRCLGVRNCRVAYRSLWDEPLGDYDAVYCFLSPAPMPRLWEKVQKELRPGALLISNTFEIPGVPARQTIELDDWRRSRLLIWRR
jgi:SAM-dependent methyltransferase